MSGAATVDVVLSVHDGARYLAEQIESVRAQTFPDWRLWVRDDGSTDGSWEVAAEVAARDRRIRVHPRDGTRMGVGPAFGWLLERLPADARWVFTCDADDVWLPEKMERSLAAMRAAEASDPGPILVHTDLTLVDETLRPLAASLWEYLDIDLRAAAPAELAVGNTATGPTLLLNRALVAEVVPIPPEAIHQDWWITLVAACTGRIVALPERTVLYRRHGANESGRLVSPEVRSLAGLARRVIAAGARTPALRAWIAATAAQAGALLERHGHRLPPDQRRALEEIAAIAGCGFLERKRRVWRNWALPGRGWVRNLGLLLRG